jgi:hypothetical protein
MVTGRTTVEDLLRDLAPQVLGLLVRPATTPPTAT